MVAFIVLVMPLSHQIFQLDLLGQGNTGIGHCTEIIRPVGAQVIARCSTEVSTEAVTKAG